MRSFDVPAVRREGSVGTFEATVLIPHKRRQERDIDNGVDGVASPKVFVVVAAATVVFGRLA